MTSVANLSAKVAATISSAVTGVSLLSIGIFILVSSNRALFDASAAQQFAILVFIAIYAFVSLFIYGLIFRKNITTGERWYSGNCNTSEYIGNNNSLWLWLLLSSVFISILFVSIELALTFLLLGELIGVCIFVAMRLYFKSKHEHNWKPTFTDWLNVTTVFGITFLFYISVTTTFFYPSKIESTGLIKRIYSSYSRNQLFVSERKHPASTASKGNKRRMDTPIDGGSAGQSIEPIISSYDSNPRSVSRGTNPNCVIKPVMSDQDYKNCGITPPR